MEPNKAAGEQTIGRYRLLEKIGAGGMGTIFKASDPELGRLVAIKYLVATSSVTKERFLREARFAARLDHPNIIRIYDIIELGDGVYIVQEFLEGKDLDGLLRNWEEDSISTGRGIDILSQVATALAFAHSREIVHRDVKPGNVWVTSTGDVKMIDFGIALSTRDDRLTMTGAVVGTLSYLAPEQFEGSNVDYQRAEVFSFGSLAFEVLSGRRAFAAESMAEIVQKILQDDPPRLHTIVPSVPRDISELIASCLHKDPARRPDGLDFIASRFKAVGSAPTVVQDIRAFGLQAPSPVPTPTHTVYERAQIEEHARGPTQLNLPQQLGRFTLLEIISQGRTGLLYKAFDPVRSDLVGVKVVSSENALDRERLLRAGKIWLDLHHKNIVRVLEVDPGGSEHGPLIISELIEGRPLNAFVAEVPLTVEQRVYIAVQICDALAAIHAKGVIHREVKPDSILVVREGLKALLLDSGIARAAAAVDSRLTRTGVVVGDLAYMAPEQLEGRPEQRSDIFSLAGVLVSLLTKSEFSVGEMSAVLGRLAAARGVSPRLRTVISRALAANPEERFDSAQAFADALDETLPLHNVTIPRSTVVVTLHGIRTHARWQRAFSEVAAERGLVCRLDKWNFGYFSVFKFLMPWSRLARVSWFRRTYQEEFPEVTRNPSETDLPSIVAHSFGTFILGNALIRYPYLRFNKVILCGSILPTSFPWHALIARGQVQAVRNEYGAQDSWTRIVDLFVPGTGASGIRGFDTKSERCEQEEFEFTHSEYFERSHMEGRWIPFLRRRLSHLESVQQPAPKYPFRHPWLLYALYSGVAGVLSAALWLALQR